MRRLLIGLVLFGAVVSALGFVLSHESSGQTFITAPVERGTISTFVKATGSVDAVITVEVSSQLSGRISEVLVNFNDEVKTGQPIARVVRCTHSTAASQSTESAGSLSASGEKY